MVEGKGLLNMRPMHGAHDRRSPMGQTEAMSDEGNVLAMPSAPEAIELRHLRAFVAVADDLNFSRAARRLFISQPALSRQIRTLERLIGCELFRRNTQRVELKMSGEALLAQAEPLLADLADAIATTRSVGGELAGRMVKLWKPWMDASIDITDLEKNRAAVEELHSRFEPPDGVTVAPVVAGGVQGLRLTPQSASDGMILFVHGGGHIVGSAFGYRHLAGAVAAAAGTPTLLVDYRLAPEHPYPSSLDDTLRAYRWLLGTGVPADKITVVGDSSGGGLVMSLLLSLREQDIPLPAGAALLCPWVDLSGRTQQPPHDSANPLVPLIPEMARHFAQLYLDGHPEDDPIVDPLHADLTGLPPLLIHVSSGEFVLPEAQLLATHGRACGMDVTTRIYRVPAHDFRVFWTFLPEAASALEQLGQFIRHVTRTRVAEQLAK